MNKCDQDTLIEQSQRRYKEHVFKMSQNFVQDSSQEPHAQISPLQSFVHFYLINESSSLLYQNDKNL